MIKVQHLTKTIDKKKILDDISLTVDKGTIYGVIGVNGAGKTTLIRHLIGAYRPDSGAVMIEDKDIAKDVAIKERVVYIPDEFPTTFGSNIKEIAKFYARVYPSWQERRYQELISRFGQDELGNFNRFSKGMKKQVMFILALAIQPDYLIMDEPFDGLDALMRKTIWDILIADVLNRQMTIVISSHHLNELDARCDKLCLLDQGKVVFEYEMNELKQRMHKVQVVFHSDLMYDKAKLDLEIVSETVTGKLYTWIVAGDEDMIKAKISACNPLLMEMLPMSLEEIFRAYLGGESDVLRL